MPWQQFCKEKVFELLGMKRTNTSYESLTHDANVALPHLLPKVREKAIDWQNWESLCAAAGINSSASDMALWQGKAINLKLPNLGNFKRVDKI